MPTAIALFSGGLDSILSCRLIMAQGITVQAVKFVTPFFDYDLLAQEKEYRLKVRKKYGIEVCLRDISQDFMEMLKAPVYGYGKNFNPCLDCKIMMATKAREMLAEFNASFIITGEVVGQRPMSQRKDTMRVVERDSRCDNLLLRPLCAKNFNPTKMELENVVDREQLLDFSGRGRAPQIRLAAEFGITDYPNASGGCVLTDLNLSGRIRSYYQERQQILLSDLRLLLIGRQFRLPGGGWLSLGRDDRENQRLLALRLPGDFVFIAQDRPSPIAILRHSNNSQDIAAAAGLVARYSKKIKKSTPQIPVQIDSGDDFSIRTTDPTPDETSRAWMI